MIAIMRNPLYVAIGIAALSAAGPLSAQDAGDAWLASATIYVQRGDYTEDAAKLRRSGFSLGAWDKWLSAGDMPPEYRSKAFRADSYLGIEIDTASKVSACHILKAGVDPRLDAIACDRLTANARFEPAYRTPGKPIARRMNVWVRWETISSAERQKLESWPAIPMPPPPVFDAALPRLAQARVATGPADRRLP